MNTPMVIGIAGGTGSGKTTIAGAIQHEIGEAITLIPQDAYYKPFDSMSVEDRSRINFDHPEAFDNQLLVQHIKALKRQVPVDMPIYDFHQHRRKPEVIRIMPGKIIIVEGILIFENKDLLAEMDIRIFVDTDPDIRVLRRIERDIRERGRTLESVITQYRDTVRPMHIEFVEPTKRQADIIIPEGGHNQIGIDMLVARIRSRIMEQGGRS